MKIDPMRKNKSLSNSIIWLLSIVACILLIIIVYQNIQIKNSQQTSLEAPGSVAKAYTGAIEPVAVNKQQADYEKTIQQLQAQLKDLQNARQDSGSPGFDQAPDPSLAPDTQGPPGTPGGAPPDGEPAGGTRGGDGRGGGAPPDGEPPGGAPGVGDGSGSDRGIILGTYSPLLKRLELSAEASDEFVKFLAERRQAWIEIEDEILTLDLLEDDREATLKELEDLAWEYDEKALELLGYKNYQKYNEYNSCMGIFLTDPVDEFKGELSIKEEINYFQEEQLASAMAEEYEDFLSSTVPEVKGPPGFKIGMQDEKTVSKIVDGLDNLQKRYITSARSILTESQMNTFKVTIQSMIIQRKLSFQSTETGDFRD